MTLSRRRFLALAGGTATATALQVAAPRFAFAAAGAPSTIVVLNLRGGMDGLSAVHPGGDAAYHDGRPNIAVADRTSRDLGGGFVAHPALDPLLDLYRSGHVAIVHAVGLPEAVRSHFAATTAVERAGGTSGWLTRHVASVGAADPLAALSMRGGLPESLRGPSTGVAVPSLDRLRLATRPGEDRHVRAALDGLYAGAPAELQAAARRALAAVDTVARIGPAAGDYPTDLLGRHLSEVVRVIKADVGLRAATIDVGGWDLHDGMGRVDAGPQRALLSSLAAGLAAFVADVGNRPVWVLTLTEFGRQLRENGSGGADHGRASCMFVAGPGVAGGKVHGTWPGLTALDGGGLRVTTDVRSVLGEVVAAAGGKPGAVLPGAPAGIGVVRRPS